MRIAPVPPSITTQLPLLPLASMVQRIVSSICGARIRECLTGNIMRQADDMEALIERDISSGIVPE
jgi:hypothetical protein